MTTTFRLRKTGGGARLRAGDLLRYAPVGFGSGAGSANTPTVAVAAPAGKGAATGAARAPTVNGAGVAGSAAANGSANAPTVMVTVVGAAGAGAATGAAYAATVDESVRVTLQPWRLLHVDDAELESLTRQGLIVGVPAPPHPASPPDAIVAYVHTTINPGQILAVGAAELESLTRQGLIYNGG